MLDRIITISQNLSRPENLHMATYEGVVIDSIYSRAFLFGEIDMSKSRFRRKCGCGLCNEYTNPGRKFIYGHQNRGKNIHSKEFKERQSKRMKENNPMKNPKVAKKQSESLKAFIG